MRVLRIAHASLTPRLRERERALVRCFPDVQLELVTTTRWQEAAVEVEAVEDDLVPVRRARPLFSRHIQLFAYDPRPVIRAMRRHRPEIIELAHEPYSVACAEVLTLRNWFAPRVPVVIQTCQNILHNYPSPFRWFEQRAFRQAAAAHICSETVREVLTAKGFDKLVRVVPFGVNVDEYTPRSVKSGSNETLTIGFFGRMLPGKGLNILAEALPKIAQENWKVLLVGDGLERESFTRRLSESNLLDSAYFTGAVKYDEMPEYFRQIDLLVIPTETTARIREQFGRVIVEAMATAVPVIGSTCGAIPEVISDAGLVVPEGDAGALADAILRLLSSERLRAELAHAGRRRVELHYSWERVAAHMYDLFRDVLRPKVATNMGRRVEVPA
jgi:glycosyltransferase involved in cell wall biosynthesis